MAKRRPQAAEAAPETNAKKPHLWSAKKIRGVEHTSAIIPRETRPCCQMCGNTLKLLTYRCTEGELKKLGALAYSGFRNDAGRVRVNAWRGGYEGWGHDEHGVPIFCSTTCAAEFAAIQYLEGHRVRMPDGTLLDRKD